VPPRRFDWDAVIGREYSLDRATDALRNMQRDEEIMAVIRPS